MPDPQHKDENKFFLVLEDSAQHAGKVVFFRTTLPRKLSVSDALTLAVDLAELCRDTDEGKEFAATHALPKKENIADKSIVHQLDANGNLQSKVVHTPQEKEEHLAAGWSAVPPAPDGNGEGPPIPAVHTGAQATYTDPATGKIVVKQLAPQ